MTQGSDDFEALARQHWGMWGDALRGLAPQAGGNAGMQGFGDALSAWSSVAGGGQGDGVELGRVPAMEKDAAAAGILDDGVEAVADLVDRLVQQHFFAAFLGHGGHDAETALLCVLQLRGGVPVQQLGFHSCILHKISLQSIFRMVPY